MKLEKSILLNILKQKGIFSHKAIDFLGNKIEIKTYKKSNYLVSLGDICNSIFVIIEGVAHNVIQSNNKDTSYFIGVEGDILTNPNDFVKTPLPLSGQIGIQALTNLKVEQVSYKDIQELYTLYPEIKQVAYNILEGFYIYFFSKYIHMLALTPNERYLAFIKQYHNLSQRIPQKYIASYLGISSESFSRFKVKMLTK